MVRGLFAVYTAYALSSEWNEAIKRQYKMETQLIQRVYVVGWCAEFLQGAFLVADDIMDEAESRRGKPAWYKVKKVGIASYVIPDQIGMMSINDTFILQSLVFRLLHQVIEDSQRCFAVISVFEQIKFRTEIGQMLDLNTVNQETRELNYRWR